MSLETLFYSVIWAWLAISSVACAVLFLMPAPYGRHATPNWGPNLSARGGWILMELPAVVAIAVCFGVHPPATPLPWVFFAAWQVHYIHRSLVFPWRLHRDSKPMPLSVALMGAMFNVINGTLHGLWLAIFATYPITWLHDPRFVGGMLLFLIGALVNVHSDTLLLRLRRRTPKAVYSIPQGGLFKWVSCPNYLGEVIEWTGWALATACLPGAAFALWTLANLMPRALAHHRWYRQRFPDYPMERRALFPGVF